MKRIAVNTKNRYEVLVGSGCFSLLGKECEKVLSSKKVMVITDENVGKLYLKNACDSLSASGFSVFTHEITAGEKSKNIVTVSEIIDDLSKKGFNRSDSVLALGGGVVGDISGFSASVFMRGISYINVPTSLLAQVDSAIGGKTGVDTNCGKNLLGTFWQPKLVFTDTKMIETLPESEYKDGLGEVLKYAILDEKMFEIVKKGGNIDEIVERAVTIKTDVVSRDETDTGERALLNLGHTIGHAIEKASNYEISHGIAVAIGIKKILECSLICGKINEEEYNKALSIYDILEIDCGLDIDMNSLLPYVFKDKKSVEGGIELIVPKKIGNVKKERMTKAQAEDFLLCRR